jgi:predicted transcriptional regulator of viral defense system
MDCAQAGADSECCPQCRVGGWCSGDFPKQAAVVRVDMSADCRDLLALQSGVISRRQAMGVGISPDVIDRELRASRWQTLQRGVYSVFTGSPTRQAELWSALHLAGVGAALSHQTAAELHKITDERSSLIHVTIPSHRRVQNVPGIVFHRSSRLVEAIHPSLLPSRTRVEDTVLDLASQASTFDEAFAVVCAACQRRLTTTQRVAEAMSRRKKMRWRRDLAEALGQVGEGALSLLEYRYIHLVERPHRLPRATKQARICDGKRSRYLDNLYGEHGLCVELDGQQAHPDDRRWEDLRRANKIIEQGTVVLRYGWTDIDRRPCETAVQVGTVLRNLGWTGRVRPCAPACPARRLVP